MLDVLDGLVFLWWQFLGAGGLFGLELDLLDEWEEVEVLGTKAGRVFQIFDGMDDLESLAKGMTVM